MPSRRQNNGWFPWTFHFSRWVSFFVYLQLFIFSKTSKIRLIIKMTNWYCRMKIFGISDQHHYHQTNQYQAVPGLRLISTIIMNVMKIMPMKSIPWTYTGGNVSWNDSCILYDRNDTIMNIDYVLQQKMINPSTSCAKVLWNVRIYLSHFLFHESLSHKLNLTNVFLFAYLFSLRPGNSLWLQWHMSSPLVQLSALRIRISVNTDNPTPFPDRKRSNQFAVIGGRLLVVVLINWCGRWWFRFVSMRKGCTWYPVAGIH